MNKGDIVYGRKQSDAIHPIIFINDRDSDFFVGAMLTKSESYEGNISMKPEHFKTADDNGLAFEFKFNNTHLVKAKLLKRAEWAPFRKIGELTQQGIEFVETVISNEPERLWEEYIRGR